MKLLKVPLHFQPQGSPDCGPTCVQIILGYYGINRALKDLRAQLHYGEMGTTAFDNGSLFLADGFSVTAVMANPLLFPGDQIEALSNRAKLRRHLNQFNKKNPKWGDNMSTLRTYLNRGGDIRPEIPTFEHIKAAIDAGNPLLTGTYARALGRNQGLFHFIVVNGYKRGRVHLTNPLREARQGWFPADRFLFAVHASSVADVDNGALIIPCL